jgi:hypothetical protein
MFSTLAARADLPWAPSANEADEEDLSDRYDASRRDPPKRIRGVGRVKEEQICPELWEQREERMIRKVQWEKALKRARRNDVPGEDGRTSRDQLPRIMDGSVRGKRESNSDNDNSGTEDNSLRAQGVCRLC